jgi:hypothetical protein
MAITQTVYSKEYPNNSKTITVDVVSRIPVGADGDEKYIVWVYPGAGVYKDNSTRVQPDPIFLYDIKRGWALSESIGSPLTISTGTITVAIDEADEGAVTVTLTTGTYAGSSLASQIQSQLNATASGSGEKVGETNQLSYLNAQVRYEDSKFLFMSGSIKSSYNDSANYANTSSMKIVGGTLKTALGFTGGYANSFDLATTSSGTIFGPASAAATIDDAICWAVMSIANQVDYSS